MSPGAEAHTGAGRDVPPRILGFGGWVLLVAALHVALGLVLYEPILFPGGDNAGYMILGESLRSGAGYRDLYLPGTPLHAKYPPGYPALLAGLGLVGGVQLFKLASLVFTAAAVALVAKVGRRAGGPAVGLAAAALLALNPVLLEYSHWVLSEAPFTALVLLALWLLPAEEPRRHAAGLAAAVLAFLVRTAGLPLLAAAIFVPATQRRWKRAAAAIAASVGAAGGWGAYQRLAAPAQPGYLRELVLRNPYDPEAGVVGAGDLVLRLAQNAWSYPARVLPESVGLVPEGPWILAALLLAGLALAGWVRSSARRIGYPEAFAFLYAGLMCAWPEVWTDRRFLLPLLPLVLVYAAVGVQALAGRVASALQREPGKRQAAGAERGGRVDGRTGRLAVAALAALLAVPAVADAGRLAPERVRCVARYRAGSPCVDPAHASFYAAARWAAANTEPNAIVANRKPTLFYWHARRRGDVYRYSSEPALVLASLEAMGADYVVVDRVSATTALYLVPAVREYVDRFEAVYAEGDPPTGILRFLQAPRQARATP